METIELPSQKFKASHPYWMIVGVLIIFVFLGSILDLILEFFLGHTGTAIAAGIAEIAFLLLPILWLAKFIPMSRNELFRINYNISWKPIVAGIIGLIGFQVFYIGFTVIQKLLIPYQFQWLYNYLTTEMDKFYYQILGGKGIFDFNKALLIGACIPAIAEELVFRGFLQRSISINSSSTKAMLYSGLIFGIIHTNLIDFIPLVILGIFLGYLADKSRSIFPGMFVHFLNNTIAVIAMFASIQLLDKPREAELTLFQSSALVIIGCLILYLSVYILKKYEPKVDRIS